MGCDAPLVWQPYRAFFADLIDGLRDLRSGDRDLVFRRRTFDV
jgi:hypothetical protein